MPALYRGPIRNPVACLCLLEAGSACHLETEIGETDLPRAGSRYGDPTDYLPLIFAAMIQCNARSRKDD
jgi:hypothetical protein